MAAQSRAHIQGRYRRIARHRMVVAWGDFCGAGAPPGVGCGRAGLGAATDPLDARRLEFAHLVPTGLDGRGRTWERRIQDVRRFPFCYALLCPSCHRKFDAANPDLTPPGPRVGA